MIGEFRRVLFGQVVVMVVLIQGASTVSADQYWLADGSSWPGSIFSVQDTTQLTHWQRALRPDDRVVPRVQSLTFLRDGSLVFCSGLDRSLFRLGSNGEQELHFGGGLVRQVRTDTSGDLYWSGLETPLDGNPLPDGFIYRKRTDSESIEVLMSFSQELVGRDWWGAFDVRDGQVYVSTLSSPSKIYIIENSIPRWIATLPLSAKSFRLESPTSIVATDGTGKLYRFSDLQNTDNYELVSESPFRFVDFAKKPFNDQFQ